MKDMMYTACRSIDFRYRLTLGGVQFMAVFLIQGTKPQDTPEPVPPPRQDQRSVGWLVEGYRLSPESWAFTIKP